LLYTEGNLIGYVGVFAFKEDEVELTSIIHPKYRKQGHFKNLLKEVLPELSRRHFKKCLFIVNRASDVGVQIVKRLNTTFSHAEYEMVSKRTLEITGLPKLELRDYTHEDIIDLAQMDAVCFNSSLDKMIFRFINSMGEKNRKVLVAIANGEKIGKVHLRFDEKNYADIHDLCILPLHRRKNYATAMVMQVMGLLRDKKINHIYLDVEGKNTSAIKLYEKCGYEITAIHDFWSYDLTTIPDFRPL
jgi:ribosomal protein S18 acetylase RimI-like enzyme